MTTDERLPQFTGEFDDEFPLGAEGNSAYFGRNVLHGLVDGIDEFVEQRQIRWRRFRSLGPAMLASAMWIDDPALIDKIGSLAGACIVVQKQRHKRRNGALVNMCGNRDAISLLVEYEEVALG